VVGEQKCCHHRWRTIVPYHDENVTLRPAYVTRTIIGLNVVAWLFVQGAGSAYAVAVSVCNLVLVPAELMRSVPPGTACPLGDGIACIVGHQRRIDRRPANGHTYRSNASRSATWTYSGIAWTL
jgi:hypothetical protein